jgi:hypothetical protein
MTKLRVDHQKEAVHHLREAELRRGYDKAMEFQIAQIHASLAIVDELKGLRSAVLSLQQSH